MQRPARPQPATAPPAAVVTLCLVEQVEKEFLPLYEDPGLGLTTFSPLYSGLLTGKYLDAKDDSARLYSDAWKDMAVRPPFQGLGPRQAALPWTRAVLGSRGLPPAVFLLIVPCIVSGGSGCP